MLWSLIDIIIFYNNIIFFLKTVASILSTVLIDPFNKSSELIKFNNVKEYDGFTVISSTNKINKRAISWFYKNYDSPVYTDWKLFLQIFFFNKIVPSHVLQLYNKVNKCNDFIYIHSINSKFIEYSFNDKYIKTPIVLGSLIPKYYIHNINYT